MPGACAAPTPVAVAVAVVAATVARDTAGAADAGAAADDVDVADSLALAAVLSPPPMLYNCRIFSIRAACSCAAHTARHVRRERCDSRRLPAQPTNGHCGLGLLP